MFQVTTTVEPQRVQDMIIGAFEGGSNYWLSRADLILPEPEDLPEDRVVWWGNSKRNIFAEPDFKIELITDEDDKHTLDAAGIQRGINVMARDCPRHFADMISENDDATTSDVFLQCCLFGEVVYG